MCGPENIGRRRPLGCPPYLDLKAPMHSPTDTQFRSTQGILHAGMPYRNARTS